MRARRKLSFDLRKEFGLDFREAFKTLTQHFGVPKWMVETGENHRSYLVRKQLVGGVWRWAGRAIAGRRKGAERSRTAVRRAT